MNKILVATDLSAHAATGIRFAIMLARQNKCKLTFFYAYQLEKPVSWSEKRFNNYAAEEKFRNSAALESQVTSIAKAMGGTKIAFAFDVKEGAEASKMILNHARKNHFNFICVSTRGAGIFKKIFGTHTSWLIDNSTIPLLIVPQKYRSGKIKTILYASDLKGLKNELTVISRFNNSLAAGITLIHVDKNSEASNTLIDDKGLKLLSKYKVKLLIENISSGGLISGIANAIDFSPPSLFVVFSRVNRSIVSKVMSPGLSAEFSFRSTVPMLVFNKKR